MINTEDLYCFKFAETNQTNQDKQAEMNDFIESTLSLEKPMNSLEYELQNQ